MTEKVNQFNRQLQGASPESILLFFHQQFPGKVVFSSSMGAEDQVITHMLALQDLKVDIFTLDTGRMFPETYELIEKTQARYNIPVKIYFPDAGSVEQMVNTRGMNLFYHSVENRKLCCHIRKIEPLDRALQGFDVWITGLRREQSPTRENLQVVEWEPRHKMIKVNPLLEWRETQLWDFIHQNKVPYNTLHDKGFPSIGCQPCTRAVMPGEDVRAGRWWWENPESKECGLHRKK